MKTMYKLVTQDYTTHAGMHWSVGKTNRAEGKGNEMCSPGLLHCYASPDEAILFNPIHANIYQPRLLRIECSEIIASDGLKYGCKEQTPTAEIPLPVWTTEMRVAFAIKCSLEVYREPAFVSWAEAWLSGEDRSADAAAYAAARTSYAAAARTSYAAAYAAAAARAAAAADAAAADAAAADAAYAARAADAAYATAYAHQGKTLDFDLIITWVKGNFKG